MAIPMAIPMASLRKRLLRTLGNVKQQFTRHFPKRYLRIPLVALFLLSLTLLWLACSRLLLLLHSSSRAAVYIPTRGLTIDALAYLSTSTPRRTAPVASDFVTLGAADTAAPVGAFRPFTNKDNKSTANSRREAVREATRRAWDAYAAHAWGSDELEPLSHKGVDNFAQGLGTTIVDSLDTLFIMGGLDGRYQRGRDWVDKELHFDRVGTVSVFEITIRILGGLMSMYHLSGDIMYLQKAEELGVRLAPAFDTPYNLPWPRCSLQSPGQCQDRFNDDTILLAEVGTTQLEFRALSLHSRQGLMRSMREIVDRTADNLLRSSSSHPRVSAYPALLPHQLKRNSSTFCSATATLGSPADSYFEYLVKSWVQGGRSEQRTWEHFADVMDAVCGIATYTSRNGHVITRSVTAGLPGQLTFNHEMDHLSCYIPGMILLGLDGLPKSDVRRRRAWVTLAENLTETCYKMYTKSPHGICGENIRLNDQDEWSMAGDNHLRPEAVEAFFYMYRHTGDEKYRDWAWTVFQSIEKHCKTADGAYTILRNPESQSPVQGNLMESFLISETFKYLFLIFGDDKDELPLSKWVFNTEAHPLLISPGLATGVTP
jgi:Glycosyl hydrolase family 47